MENYKQATKLKLRFQTTSGPLTIEQLWDLSLKDLDALAVSLEQDYKNSKGKSFLVKKTTKDKVIKLKFDIVLDILTTKVEDEDAIKKQLEDKEHNQKIMALIKEKEEEGLKGKTVDELKALLR